MKKIMIIVAAIAAIASAKAELCVTNGQTVAFMGDSITQFGGDSAGYVSLVMKGLEIAGVKNVTRLGLGVGGEKSKQMHARLDRDVLARRDKRRVDWMTFSCGVNDVGHGKNGVTLDQYKVYVADIFDRCAASNVNVIVLTATMCGEDPNNANNQKLAGYNEFLRSEAKRRGLRLADLNADMQAELAEIRKHDQKPGHKLTRDGLHMAFPGDCMMAWGVLKAMGIDPALKDRLYAAWRQIPGAYRHRANFTAAQWALIKDKLSLSGNADAWLAELLVKAPVSKLRGDKSMWLQMAKDQTEPRVFAATNGLRLAYRWREPTASAGKYPLVVFLHGAGERGGNNYSQMFHGVPELINYGARKDKPFFLLAPQCPNGGCPGDPQGIKWVQLNWAEKGVQTMPAVPSKPMTALIELLEQTLKDPRIDTSRVYVTGLSMGGYGTWDLACRRPQWFAAVMPLCGGCDEQAALALKGTAVKIIHGGADNVVPPIRGRRAYEALKAAGGKVDYVEYPGVGHGCWNPAFADDKILDWLFSQHR